MSVAMEGVWMTKLFSEGSTSTFPSLGVGCVIREITSVIASDLPGCTEISPTDFFPATEVPISDLKDGTWISDLKVGTLISSRLHGGGGGGRSILPGGGGGRSNVAILPGGGGGMSEPGILGSLFQLIGGLSM